MQKIKPDENFAWMRIQESFLSILLLHWLRQLFLGIPAFISDPGNLCVFLDLFVSPWLSVLNLGSCICIYTSMLSMYIHTYTDM